MEDDKKKQEEIKKYYDDDYFIPVSTYKSYKDLFRSRLRKFRIKQLLKLYSPGKNEKLVDLGCALGHISFAFAPYCKKIIGIDYSRTAIKQANKLLKTSPFRNIKFIVSSADNVKLPSNSFDVIISADLFEHLYPDVYLKTLNECKRLLKKKGKLIIWTPHRGHIIEILKKNNIILKKDISHVSYKKMDDLKIDLIKRGFLIRKAYYTESHLPVFNVFEKILLSFLPFMRRRISILAEKN